MFLLKIVSYGIYTQINVKGAYVQPANQIPLYDIYVWFLFFIRLILR